MKTHRGFPNWKAATWSVGLALWAASLSGCADDGMSPEGEPSEQARATATVHATQVLEVEALAARSAWVDDLVGGFAVGIADETAGLEMEIGTELGLGPAQTASLSAGRRLADAAQKLDLTCRQLQAPEYSRPALAKVAPGDLLFSDVVDNLDGSRTRTEVYQGEPEAVVRVLQTTTWPNGNPILTSIQNEILVDRGNDFADESDDLWLSLSNRLDFVSGASLQREVDARQQGGLQDFARVELVSTWTPRPRHRRLVESVTTLTVDLEELESESDDRFVRIDRETRFSGTTFDGESPRVVESLVPESPVAEGEEPCGGELSRDIWFRADRGLRQWSDRAVWSCEGGGSLSRHVVRANGGEDSLTLTRGSDGVVRLDASAADGTTVTGSYDEAARTFELTVNHPSGSNPVQESLAGTTNADETAWQLDATVTYADGFVERSHLEGREDDEGQQLSGSQQGRDESWSFRLDANPEQTRLVGHVENDREQVLDFELEELADGSHLVDFVATEPGLTVEGHLEVDPDGCGEGTLDVTENGATVTIEIRFCDRDVEVMS